MKAGMSRKQGAAAAWARATAVTLTIGAAVVLLPTTIPAAYAADKAGEMMGVGESETAVMQATVKSVDVAKRTLVLVGPSGETKSMKVGPEVKNLAQVKAGDVIVARYSEAVAYVIAPPNSKTPEDLIALATERAAPGQKPAGGVEALAVVTALVVGVSPTADTLSLVDPAGGEVQTVAVNNPEYQKMLPDLKVGDTITAVMTESIVVAVEPAKK